MVKITTVNDWTIVAEAHHVIKDEQGIHWTVMLGELIVDMHTPTYQMTPPIKLFINTSHIVTIETIEKVQ